MRKRQKEGRDKEREKRKEPVLSQAVSKKKKEKRKPQTRRKHLQNTYMIMNSSPTNINNPYNSSQ